MANKYNAKPTEYKGIRFKSSLEAWWESALDALGYKWDYEPYTLVLHGQKGTEYHYRPDFLVYTSDDKTWDSIQNVPAWLLECKGYMLNEARAKLKAYLYTKTTQYPSWPSLFIAHKKDYKDLTNLKDYDWKTK